MKTSTDHSTIRQKLTSLTAAATLALLLAACGNTKNTAADSAQSAEPVGPAFMADSAFRFCEDQCSFGPRTMNSKSHDECGGWIAKKFEKYGCTVVRQQATLRGYDGTPLHATNIIASYRPEAQKRIMICAHWDSRPWADNDPNPDNWRKPVMAANDGASGVAVMLELARLLADSTLYKDSAPLAIGVDFICFDAEDWGTPQWEENRSGDSETWALGAQYWAITPHQENYNPMFGILLDMVGGEGAQFCQEQVSLHYASDVVRKVWAAAQTVGFSSFFPMEKGSGVTDDHLAVNRKARIPCIDIIPYHPDCDASSFGPTWHTLDDDMAHIDKRTLQAVGQTLVQVLFSQPE